MVLVVPRPKRGNWGSKIPRGALAFAGCESLPPEPTLVRGVYGGEGGSPEVSHPSLWLKLEDDVEPGVVEALRQRGHALGLVPAHSPLMGHPGVIAIDPASGQLAGAHDPRSDGWAIGL